MCRHPEQSEGAPSASSHAVVWCSPHPPHPANPQRSQVRAGEPRAWSPVRFAIIDCFTALAENSPPWSFLNASRPNRGRFAGAPVILSAAEDLLRHHRTPPHAAALRRRAGACSRRMVFASSTTSWSPFPKRGRFAASFHVDHFAFKFRTDPSICSG